MASSGVEAPPESGACTMGSCKPSNTRDAVSIAALHIVPSSMYTSRDPALRAGTRRRVDLPDRILAAGQDSGQRLGVRAGTLTAAQLSMLLARRRENMHISCRLGAGAR